MTGPKITQGFQWEIGQRKGLFGLPNIEVVFITGKEFGETADIIRQGALQRLNEIRKSETSLKNNDTGWELVINSNDLSKIAKDKKQTVEVLQTISAIEIIVARAVLAESHKDNKHKNPDVQGIHRMYAAIEIDGKLYRVKLTIRDYFGLRRPNKTNLHAIAAIEIEKRPDVGLLTGQPKAEGTGTITLSPERFKTSISDLLAESTRHDGSEWDFSDIGAWNDVTPDRISGTAP